MKKTLCIFLTVVLGAISVLGQQSKSAGYGAVLDAMLLRGQLIQKVNSLSSKPQVLLVAIGNGSVLTPVKDGVTTESLSADLSNNNVQESMNSGMAVIRPQLDAKKGSQTSAVYIAYRLTESDTEWFVQHLKMDEGKLKVFSTGLTGVLMEVHEFTDVEFLVPTKAIQEKLVEVLNGHKTWTAYANDLIELRYSLVPTVKSVRLINDSQLTLETLAMAVNQNLRGRVQVQNELVKNGFKSTLGLGGFKLRLATSHLMGNAVGVDSQRLEKFGVFELIDTTAIKKYMEANGLLLEHAHMIVKSTSEFMRGN